MKPEENNPKTPVTSPGTIGSANNMKNITITLTRWEAEHVSCLLENNRREGWYSGNQSHYWNRAERIENKIRDGLNSLPHCLPDENTIERDGQVAEH